MSCLVCNTLMSRLETAIERKMEKEPWRFRLSGKETLTDHAIDALAKFMVEQATKEDE